MRHQLIAAASAVALATFAGAAMADPPAQPPGDDTAVAAQGVVGADYSHLWIGGGNANIYGGELSGILPVTGDFAGQVSGAYHRVEATGGGLNDWNVAGTLAWTSHQGRIGANVGYDGLSASGLGLSATNYGVYGEYYAGDQFTLGLRGGGATVSGGAFGFSAHRTGGYVGGEAIGYFMPDLAVRGTVGYFGIAGGHETTVGVHGEYLFSETFPISAWVGYDYANLGGGGSISGNTLSVGLKYYFGGSGSLERHQRTGVDDWGPQVVDITP
jgi:hypothetical protein